MPFTLMNSSLSKLVLSSEDPVLQHSLSEPHDHTCYHRQKLQQLAVSTALLQS